MTPSSPPLALVVIAGPQASGKSTVAVALSEALRRAGESVALVELDRIAAMALPTLPSWDTAHHVFELVVARWARSDLSCVIAEGSGAAEEVARLLAQLPEGAVAVTAVTTAPFDLALVRAQADPTRGISRERSFLYEVYERWSHEVDRIESDVLLNTADLDPDQCVERVMDAIAAARAAGDLG
ncbi:hypothetical protein ACFOYW_08440 [Gryllotalpicola reticulitermitis]|uniref:Adenylyl-sulfate kinase n=1 Tax=Gryllotalpicola reticulitermitis TaxID=1184153 RepID=A0ABV8Q8B1_9MICO